MREAGHDISRAAPVGGDMPILAQGLRYDVAGQTLLDIARLELVSHGPTLVMGPNGAGKSLLVRLLHGLLTPTAGRVSFGGRPHDAATARRQAMVFQKPVLLRRTVAANLDYALKAAGVPRRERGARIAALLEEGDLTERAHQRARTLSGGEGQRLALVRALATRPSILFLDEPTASLDPGAAQRIERLIAEAAARGTKVVMVTHDPGQARRLGEEIVFMHRGAVAEITPAAEFFEHPQSAAAHAFLSGQLLTS